MTRSDEVAALQAMAAAHAEGDSLAPWSALIARIMPNHLDSYAEVRRDRLILRDAGHSVKASIEILMRVHGYSASTTRRIVEGSAGVNDAADALYNAMSTDERAARLAELLL